jgi:hypothetical protein
MSTADHEHLFRSTGSHIATVPVGIIDGDYYRPALPGEAMVPVIWDEARCEDCPETTFGWRLIRVEDIDRVQAALDNGCDGACRCRCHETPDEHR